MDVPLECVDSTIAPRAVADVVREAHGIDASAGCELIQHNLDALYVLSDGARRYVARLYNARWWRRDEVEAELSVARHLNARGVRAAAPVPRSDGGWVTTVRAPEGERQLALYEFCEGDGVVPTRDARKLGQFLARMHRALADCTSARPRRELTPSGLMGAFDDVLAQSKQRSEHHHRYVEDLRARVLAKVEDVGLASFRQGICHGDMNFANAVRQADGELALYDFECCGPGILAYDLAVFRWTQRLVGAPEPVWPELIAGYRSEAELPERELDGIPLLVLLRQVYLLGHDARRTRIESLGTRWLSSRRSAKLDALRELDAELFGTAFEARW